MRRLDLRPLVLLAVGVAVVVLVASRAGDSGRTLSVVVPDATGLVKSQRISDGANDIGSVTKIEPVRGGRQARLDLRITDDSVWPLRDSSRIEIRLGGTASFSNRYLHLVPGRTGATIPDGGRLPSSRVKVPFEVDHLVSQLTPRVRQGIGGALRRSSAVVERSEGSLQRTLRRTPAMTRQLAGVFQDLAQDQGSLDVLVRSTDRVVDAVHRSTPDVRVLIEGAAATVDAVAGESETLKSGLVRLPAALRQTQETLARARSTLRRAGALTDALAPGVTELRKTAAPLTQTLRALRDATPLALAALGEPQQQAIADGARVVRRLGTLAPRLTSLLKQTATQTGCLRPWTPEIVGFGTTWGDWMSPVDDRDHLIRAQVQNFLPSFYNSVPYTPEQATKLFSGITYGFPRPPGAIAGQPWFQPQCGVTEDALDPSKDHEAKLFRANQLPPGLRP